MSNANVADGKKRKGAGCLRWLGRGALGFLILLVVLVTTGAIYQAIASARDSKQYKPVDQMVNVNGTEMRLDCRGSGSPTVILEAGGQSPSFIWVRIQDEVAKFTRVCSYDRAGYGWSDSVHETLYPQQVAEMLHILLENGGEKPPYLMVGHSFGGVYIRAFTAEYPDEVVGMVLVDSSHENQNQLTPPELAQSPEYAQLKKGAVTSLQLIQIAEPIGLLRAFKFMDAGTASLSLPENEKGAVLAQMYRAGFMGAYVRETLMMMDYSGKPRKLGDLPLIVLSRKIDAQDMVEQIPSTLQSMELAQQLADIANDMQDELAALSTRSKWIVVEDSGHFIQLDKPQVVIDAIQEVFDQVAK
ncbi:MAG: alpha/beta hydrolase [Anaerolineales bacterium]|nr:alpha/beta hydrolase [Anaerolineales bacterium]